MVIRHPCPGSFVNRRAFKRDFDLSILPTIADSAEDLTAIFEDLLAHPEIGFTETRTAQIVAGQLQDVGVLHAGLCKVRFPCASLTLVR